MRRRRAGPLLTPLGAVTAVLFALAILLPFAIGATLIWEAVAPAPLLSPPAASPR